MAKRFPRLCHHKASGRAYATDPITGRPRYFGPWGSADAQAAYDRWIAELAVRRSKPATSSLRRGAQHLVSELVAAYLEFADEYYVKAGQPTSEPNTVRQAVRYVLPRHGETKANHFGPLELKACRAQMVAAGLSRVHINRQVQRICRIWRWGVEHQIVEPAALLALRAVAPLKAGRSAAGESKGVASVPIRHVTATLPHLSRTLRSMVLVHLYAGMRSQDVRIMRPCDVDRSTSPWIYTPHTHKTEHHGKHRRIFLGRRAQKILGPILDDMTARKAFVFSTVGLKGNGRRRGCYTRAAYNRAITRACDLAGVPRWTPLQLRHTAATQIRAKYGLEGAQVILGHAHAAVSEIYAERDHALARKIANEFG